MNLIVEIENIVEEKFNDLKRKIPADVEESRNSKVQKSNRSSPGITKHYKLIIGKATLVLSSTNKQKIYSKGYV